MVLKTKEENRTNAQDKPLCLRVELVHLFPLVVQKLSSLIITEFTKYKSNSPSKCRDRACQTKVTEPCRSAVIKHDIFFTNSDSSLRYRFDQNDIGFVIPTKGGISIAIQ